MAEFVFWTCFALLAYHVILYPALLVAWAARRPPPVVHTFRMDGAPTVTLIVPIFNEANVIKKKVENLGQLIYPGGKLEILLIFDGTTDESVSLARTVKTDDRISLRVFNDNRGKVAVLNDAISECRSDIVALNDASAMLEPEALMRSVAYFSSSETGVVCPSYALPAGAEAGQEKYWGIQRKIKAAESRVHSVVGPHGAFYLFRRVLWAPIAADTINDDFILPMSIVLKGYRAVYAPEVVAQELENSPPNQDSKRRVRIAAGNLQQAVRLWKLALPSQGALAFLFASGKGLRALVPLFASVGFVALFFSALKSPFYAVFLAASVGALVLAGLTAVDTRGRLPKPLAAVGYFVRGLGSGLLGSLLLLFGWKHRAWQITRGRPNKSH